MWHKIHMTKVCEMSDRQGILEHNIYYKIAKNLPIHHNFLLFQNFLHNYTVIVTVSAETGLVRTW